MEKDIKNEYVLRSSECAKLNAEFINGWSSIDSIVNNTPMLNSDFWEIKKGLQEMTKAFYYVLIKYDKGE